MGGGAESVGKCGERCGEVCWGMREMGIGVWMWGRCGECWKIWRKVSRNMREEVWGGVEKCW